MESNSKWNYPKRQPIDIYTSAITSDGILVLPKECLNDFCDENDSENYVLTNSWEEGVICVYHTDAFEDIISNFSKLNLLDSRIRSLRRRIIGESVNIKITDGTLTIFPTFLMSLGFDVDQEANRIHSPFQVTILKFPEKIEIVSTASFEGNKLVT